jgi:pyridine nucleotide-disulfide oxidoreductase
VFQPLSYQVATGALSPGEVAYPLRAVFKRNRNVRVLLAEVDRLHLERREVVLGSVGGLPAPEPVPYDTLIVAGGSHYSYFGHDDWSAHPAEVKSLESALTVRSRILLVEALDRVLSAFPPSLSAKAERSLRRLGVTPALGSTVVDVDETGVTLQDADGATRRISARTVVWAAGDRVRARRAVGRVHRRGGGPRAARDGRGRSHPARASRGLRARRHGPRPRPRRHSDHLPRRRPGRQPAGPLRREGRPRSPEGPRRAAVPLAYAKRIALLRSFYLRLSPELEPYLVVVTEARPAKAPSPGAWQLTLTAAGMVAVINSVVIGACAGLVLEAAGIHSLAIPVALGAAIGAAAFTLHERHHRRTRDAYSAEAVDLAAIFVPPSQERQPR